MFIEFQKAIYKSYAQARYNTDNINKLSKQEKQDLEIVVKVEEGSSIFDIDAQEILEKMAVNMASSLTGDQVVLITLSLGAMFFTASSIKLFLNNRKEIRLQEVTSETELRRLEQVTALSEQETRRMEILTQVQQREPVVRHIHNYAEDLQNEMMKSFSGATSVQVDGKVGIGTSSPDEKLHITGSAKLDFGSENGNPRLYLDHDSVTDDANYIQLNRGDAGLEIVSENNVKFRTNDSERMRIDSSGNLLVGTTTTKTGAALRVDGGINKAFNNGNKIEYSGDLPTVNAGGFLQFNFAPTGCGPVCGEVFLIHSNSGNASSFQLKFNFKFGRCGGGLQDPDVQVEWSDQWGTPSIARVGTSSTVRISIQNTSGMPFNFGGSFVLGLLYGNTTAATVLESVTTA